MQLIKDNMKDNKLVHKNLAKANFVDNYNSVYLHVVTMQAQDKISV